MTTLSNHLATLFRSGRILAAVIALFAFAAVSVAPLHAAAELPGDDDQDVLIRTTLMTFNDANMTNDYSVLFAKASKEFQSQLAVEKLQAAFFVDYSMVLAGATLASITLLVLFVVAGRQLVSGIMQGAVKG